jgi:RND family efflux transporter MFP subunit
MKRSHLLRALWILLGLIAIAVIVLWMSGFFATKIPPDRLADRRAVLADGAVTATVVEETVAVVEESAGTVEAERRTMISSRILATIRAVHVTAGQQVAVGEPLIELDDRALAAAAEQAQRAVDAAAAMRARRASDFERARQLLREGVMSRSEFEQIESAAKVAAAELESARQALEAATVARSYAVITSPVSGRVVDRLADPGDTAAPGKPLLAIYDPTALRLEAAVRQGLASRLSVGSVLRVRLEGSAQPFAAEISEIVPQAEAGSRSVFIKVRLPPRADLFTGTFGRVLVPVGERKVLAVPRAAVEQAGQLSFVTAVDAERKLSRRLVTLGQELAGERVEVLSGLRAGDEVVLF